MMIKAPMGHIQFHINAENVGFYRDLMTFVGWTSLYDDQGAVGFSDGGTQSLWFTPRLKEVDNDYDGAGLNHFAFAAASIADVDLASGYLRDRGIELLFDTPRHRPDFTGSDTDTYYQVMFESPDRILFEIVYTGPK
jgi:catechol 2,3-dioxygenase-like lactoylglutathione lyase family enzyme